MLLLFLLLLSSLCLGLIWPLIFMLLTARIALKDSKPAERSEILRALGEMFRGGGRLLP